MPTSGNEAQLSSNLIMVSLLALFAFFAPADKSILLGAMLASSICIVSVTTRVLTGTSPALSASFKAVWLSLFFVLITAFCLFSSGTITGIPALGAIALFFCSYVAGFSIALETTLGASAVIALISTVVSQLLHSFLLG